ncbi:hypothetical protein DFH06DRAFT_1253022 [Mycena polygramma]|nr:hypothetical protein DFH06DRAFT_1253022 [Mycena polygramma]
MDSSQPMGPRPTSEDIASATGPLLIGVLITWYLMGIYTMQAYCYFMHYNDSIFVRGLVITVSVLELAQWIISTSDAWYYLVRSWGNISEYLSVPWEAITLVLLCGISSMIVQSFYAWRIWRIAYDTWPLRLVAILVEGLSLMQGSSAIAAAALLFRNPTNHEIARRRQFFDVWLIGSLVTDTLISLCMLWILLKARNNTPRPSSKIMFDKLIVNTVKTGSATTIIAAATLILFDGFPDRIYYGTTFNFLQKLYAISLLANLNARQRSSDSSAEASLELNFSDIVLQVAPSTATESYTSYREQESGHRATSLSFRAIHESLRSSVAKRFSSTSRTGL